MGKKQNDDIRRQFVQVDIGDYCTKVGDHWYLRKNWLRQKCPDVRYYILLGSNSAGKSHMLKEMALDNFAMGRESLFVRRIKDDIKTSKLQSYFSDVYDYIQAIGQQMYGEGTYHHFDVEFRNSTFYLVGFPEAKTRKADKEILGVVMYSAPLSKWSGGKSSSVYPKLRDVFFEEILPTSDAMPLPNEWDCFKGLVKTVARGTGLQDDTKIWLFGNLTNSGMTSQILDGMSIPTRDMPTGLQVLDYYIFDKVGNKLHNNAAVLRYAGGIGQSEKEEAITAFSNQDIMMSVNGEWETNEYPKRSWNSENQLKPEDEAYVLINGAMKEYVYAFEDHVFVTSMRMKFPCKYYIIWPNATVEAADQYNNKSDLALAFFEQMDWLVKNGKVYFATDQDAEFYNQLVSDVPAKY